jgi:hypothetical protein
MQKLGDVEVKILFSLNIHTEVPSKRVNCGA